MKLKELKERASALNKFLSLPKSIQHQRLVSDPTLHWEKSQETWYLRLEAVNLGEFAQHENNYGSYRLAYVLDGPDGEEQALPYTSEELMEFVEYDLIMFSGGLFGDDIPKLIDKMKDWLEKGDNVRIS